MQKYTNSSDIPVELAVWLITDNYDYNPDPNTISVTTLLKSTRQLVLRSRLLGSSGGAPQLVDISSKVASAMGSSLHEGIENAWIRNYKQALIELGHPKGMIDAIRINPIEPYEEDTIKIFLEQRNEKTVGKWTISGKFDFCVDGRIKDVKSTSTYTYIRKSNEKNYALQGSIYRWLNQGIVTDDIMTILYIFTDWKAIDAYKDGYPKARLLEHKIELLSVQQTETYIVNKLSSIEALLTTPEVDLPLCSDEELWANDPSVFKYYKDPSKTSRSTKNFNSYYEAREKYISDGSVGSVIEVPAQAKACRYCDVFTLCSQKDSLIASGRLKI